jgi:SAM-dependent methyltransferase
LFIGCLPLYGLHLPLCLAVCLPLRLDVVVAYLAANISNPLFAPFLLTLEVEVGSLLLTGKHAAFDVERARETGIAGFVWQAAVGSLVVGAVLGATGAVSAALVATRRRTRRQPELADAIGRTLARYRDCKRGDRIYVAAKLSSDPIVGELVKFGELGDVLDAGSGRGQLGLLLLELGATRSLRGLDWDERKVAVARRAAGRDARFDSADLRRAALGSADTVLLLDVLHYLPSVDQDAVLARAAECLRPGGRLVLRDMDRTRHGSLLGRFAERVAGGLRYNRGAHMEFRGADVFARKLAELGLPCESTTYQPVLGNVLIVARRPAQPSPRISQEVGK